MQPQSTFDWDIKDIAQHINTDINNARNIINKRKRAKPGCIRYIRATGTKKQNIHFRYNSVEIIQHFKHYPVQVKKQRHLDLLADYDRPGISEETQNPYNQLAFHFLKQKPLELSDN